MAVHVSWTCPGPTTRDHIKYQGTKLSPRIRGPRSYHIGSLVVSPELMSSHEFGSAGSVGFPIMISTPLLISAFLPLFNWTPVPRPSVCGSLHLLSSVSRWRLYENSQGTHSDYSGRPVPEPSPLLLGILAGVILIGVCLICLRSEFLNSPSLLLPQ